MKYILIILVGLSLNFGSNVFGQDKLSALRTEKKIITVASATDPYYAVQILALKEPPREPEFFKNISTAREFECADGFVRYVVGQFKTATDAMSELERVKSLGYNDAFIVNTKKLGVQANNNSVVGASIDPNKTYTIQVAAFRFPVYLSHFENLDDIMEFYMKDKVYRYCVGKYLGSDVLAELDKVKQLGYPDACIILLDNYLPYQIE